VTEQQLAIEQFKLKRIIKKLDESRGNGTSVISIYIPQKKRIEEVTTMLTDEHGKAANVKDKINK
jgi:peptide chain release factor subunit 1